MQASEFEPWLETAVADVLESMCFFSIAGEAEDEGAQDWICGRLDFYGVPSGSFGISLPPRTALTLAANFLGEDEPEIDQAQASEAVCELANMICGALLARREPKRTFDLSSPASCFGKIEQGEGVDRISRTFQLEEGFLQAWLQIVHS